MNGNTTDQFTASVWDWGWNIEVKLVVLTANVTWTSLVKTESIRF